MTITDKLILEIGDARCVGINGLDCSGKTTLAQSLVDRCAQRGINSVLLHVDDYNNAAVQDKIYAAYAAGQFTQALMDDYYHYSVEYAALFAAIDAAKKQNQGLLIVEGVFLFRPPVDGLLDYRIFLEIAPAAARERYAVRKSAVGDTRPVAVFDDIWVPAFKRYCAEFAPQAKADVRL